MRKIKIGNVDVEADDETVRWLVFGTGSQVIESTEKQGEGHKIIDLEEPYEQEPEAQKKKLCVICGKPVPKHKQKFCSTKCRQTRDLETKKKWYDKNKDALSEKKQEKKHTNCVICGKPLAKRMRLLCGDEKCVRKYKNNYQNEKRALMKGITKVIVAKQGQAKHKKEFRCIVCDGKIRKHKGSRRRKFCSRECKKKYHASNKQDRPKVIIVQKKTSLPPRGGVKHENKPADSIKEARRRYIEDTASRLAKYSGVPYEKALSMASLEWEALLLKREKEKEISPELRLIQSLAKGEIGAITPRHLEMIDPEQKFSEFATWVATNEAVIKGRLGITGKFIINPEYIRYQKN